MNAGSSDKESPFMSKEKKYLIFLEILFHIYFKSLLAKIEWILGCPRLLEMLIISFKEVHDLHLSLNNE